MGRRRAAWRGAQNRAAGRARRGERKSRRPARGQVSRLEARLTGDHLYSIALGSNRRHGRHGTPRAVLRAAMSALAGLGEVEQVSPIVTTAAVGPAGRSFANATLILRTMLEPDHLLAGLKQVEREFGRRRGRRWGPRVLDLDILLWSGGAWAGGALTVPHPEFRRRRFVLDPLVAIAPGWRDPITGLTVRQLHARLLRRRPVDPGAGGA